MITIHEKQEKTNYFNAPWFRSFSVILSMYFMHFNYYFHFLNNTLNILEDVSFNKILHQYVDIYYSPVSGRKSFTAK